MTTTEMALEEKPVILDEKSEEFLLKEQDRLVGYQTTTLNNYATWFSIYLAVASGTITIIVPLVQTINPANQSITNIILFGLLIFGIANIIALSFESVLSIRYEQAIMLIQDYFIQREHRTVEFLHFRIHNFGMAGTGLKALIIRGLTGVSPRVILVFINSIIGAVLVTKISAEYGVLPPDFILGLFIGAIIFFLLITIHLFYVRVVYKVYGV